jgi:phosphoglycerol transferase MdoB-like AlkP superfamily enzyme
MISRLTEYMPVRFLVFGFLLFISSLLIQNQFELSISFRKISWIGWLLEPLLLTFVMYVIYRVSARVIFSAVVVTMLYFCLVFLNEQKITALEIPLVPADFIYAKQLFYLNYSAAYFVIAAGVLLLFIAFLVGAYKLDKPSPLSIKTRWQAVVITSGLVVLVMASQKQIAWWVNSTHNKVNRPNLMVESESLGVLAFLSKKYLIKQTTSQPPNYSEATIQRLIKKYQVAEPAIQVADTEKPNVIIFLIEAFADPLENGYFLTEDPIPVFRSLSQSHPSGHVLSPVVGGRSANAEFELLTGLSMRFIPKGSIPFIDLLHRPMVSIAAVFKRSGYQTHALHVASLSFFNYNNAYPNLGFDHVQTLMNQRPISYDPAGRYPNESSLVDEIISLTKSTQPQFIHAFPNSTHGPYDYDTETEIAWLEKTNSPDAKEDKIITYINALNEADKAIGKLIQHFESGDEKTIILVLGDHLPGLIPYRLKKTSTDFLAKYPDKNELMYPAAGLKKQHIKGMIEAFNQKDAVLYHLSNHLTPYVLWSNFPLKNSFSGDISMNLLHLKLMEVVDSQEPFFQITKAIHQRYGMYSAVINENNRMVFAASANELQADYELIQYDILYGKNYYHQIVSEFNLDVL